MDALIDIVDYTFTYAGRSRPALENITCAVKRGEFLIVAGPSGCGKSTLLRSLIGLIPHMYPGTATGTVRVNGRNVAETSISQLATQVGYVFQNPENQIFMFSVERDIGFGLENLGLPRGEIRRRVDWVLDLLGLASLARRAPHELSDGQKQRVALAGVLVMEPQVLILDEPTALLDPYAAGALIEQVAQLHQDLGLTVLVVEHRLDLLAPVADRLVVLDQGRIVRDGLTREVLADPRIRAVGVGVPTISRLYQVLRESDAPLTQLPLTSLELVEQVKRIKHDPPG